MEDEAQRERRRREMMRMGQVGMRQHGDFAHQTAWVDDLLPVPWSNLDAPQIAPHQAYDTGYFTAARTQFPNPYPIAPSGHYGLGISYNQTPHLPTLYQSAPAGNYGPGISYKQKPHLLAPAPSDPALNYSCAPTFNFSPTYYSAQSYYSGPHYQTGALPAAFAAQPLTNSRVGYDFLAGERGVLGRGPTLFEVPLEIQVDFSDPFAAKDSDPFSSPGITPPVSPLNTHTVSRAAFNRYSSRNFVNIPSHSYSEVTEAMAHHNRMATLSVPPGDIANQQYTQIYGSTPEPSAILALPADARHAAVSGAALLAGLKHPTATQIGEANCKKSEINEHVINMVLAENHSRVGDPYEPDPFVRLPEVWPTSQYGVIKISFVPYEVTKADIVQFLGKDANLIRNQFDGVPIHIMMERTTQKTMDCFVEFLTPKAAKDFFRKRWGIMSDKALRIGKRRASVKISSQDEFLATLFEHTRCIVWQDGLPYPADNLDPNSIGFQGFLSDEEMYCLGEYTERPWRSAFMHNSEQRPFECMIDILYKYPWQATHLYKIGQRNIIFRTYLKMLDVLVTRVVFEKHIHIDRRLLEDFVHAGANCVGFSERMRFKVMTHSRDKEFLNLVSPFSEIWPFDALRRKPHVNEASTQMYLRCIEAGFMSLGADRSACTRVLQQYGLLPQGYTYDVVEMSHERDGFFDILYNILFHTTDDHFGQRSTFHDALLLEQNLAQFLVQQGVANIKATIRDQTTVLAQGNTWAPTQPAQGNTWAPTQPAQGNTWAPIQPAHTSQAYVEVPNYNGAVQGMHSYDSLPGTPKRIPPSAEDDPFSGTPVEFRTPTKFNPSATSDEHGQSFPATPSIWSSSSTPTYHQAAQTCNAGSEVKIGGSQNTPQAAVTSQDCSSIADEATPTPKVRPKRSVSEALNNGSTPLSYPSSRGHLKASSLPFNPTVGSPVHNFQNGSSVRLGTGLTTALASGFARKGLTGSHSASRLSGKKHMSISESIPEEDHTEVDGHSNGTFVKSPGFQAIAITNPKTGEKLTHENGFTDKKLNGSNGATNNGNGTHIRAQSNLF